MRCWFGAHGAALLVLTAALVAVSGCDAQKDDERGAPPGADADLPQDLPHCQAYQELDGFFQIVGDLYDMADKFSAEIGLTFADGAAFVVENQIHLVAEPWDAWLNWLTDDPPIPFADGEAVKIRADADGDEEHRYPRLWVLDANEDTLLYHDTYIWRTGDQAMGQALSFDDEFACEYHGKKPPTDSASWYRVFQVKVDGKFAGHAFSVEVGPPHATEDGEFQVSLPTAYCGQLYVDDWDHWWDWGNWVERFVLQFVRR
jgi:hypothetical protein